MRIQHAILCALCVGCFSDGPSVGDDDDGAPTGGSGSDSSGSATSIGSASGSGSGASMTSVDPTGTTTSDTETTDAETGMPSCGMLGEPCCDGACEEGSCWHQRCVMLAGMYAEPNTCNGCTTELNGDNMEIPPSTIPFLGLCECPAGFRTAMPLPTTSDYCPDPMLLHTDTDVRFCEHDTLYPEKSDWIGAYATSTDPACMTEAGSDCLAENLYTRACSCPADALEMVAETWTPCNGTDGDPEQLVQIHICIDPNVEPINFGGAFQERWLPDGNGVDCSHGNPLVGDACGCPPGFRREGVRITSPMREHGGDLFICVP